MTLLLAILTIFAGIGLANFLFDHHVPLYISRKIGHAVCGICFLLCISSLTNIWWLVTFFLGCGISAIIIKKIYPQSIRGLANKKSGEAQSVLLIAPIILIAYLWAARPAVAISCILFLTWGDAIAGLIRARVANKPNKSLWGSLGMFLICMAIVLWWVRPTWIGITGALGATAVEWACGQGILRRINDNWAIPLVTMSIMVSLFFFA